MENDIKLWLADIKRSTIEIYDFLPEEKSFLIFQQDLKTRKAVEKKLTACSCEKSPYPSTPKGNRLVPGPCH